LPDLIRLAVVAAVAAASTAVSTEAVMRMTQPRSAELRTAGAAAAPDLRAGADGVVPKASDGHYWAQGEVNGREIRFLVDTGATAVALTPADARRLGIDLAALHYGYDVVTAAGRARAASVRLSSISVAGARLDDVDALVIENGLDASLLGMSYLGRLSSFQATPKALVLRP
jgi:aspartyl protease family protein